MKYDLSKFTTYLSGPMEFQREECHLWRNEIKEKLIDLGMNSQQIIDPVERTPEEEWGKFAEYRQNNQWSKIEENGKKIYQKDLRYVDKSDFLIVHLFEGIKTCGTWDEIFMACGQRKPVFVIQPGGLKNASVWLIARVGWRQIFGSIDELVGHIKNISEGIISAPKRWETVYV